MSHIVVEKGSNVEIFNKLYTKNFHCHCKGKLCTHTIIQKRLLHSLHLLQKKWIRELYITSGYRCQSHNRKVGGVKNSKHTRGQAVDIVCPIDEFEEFVKTAEDFFDVVLPYKKNNFIHCHNL